MTEPVEPRRRSQPQILVPLQGSARAAVIALWADHRDVIFGDRVGGVKIHAEHASAGKGSRPRGGRR